MGSLLQVSILDSKLPQELSMKNEKSVKKSLTTNYRKALCNFVYMPGIHSTFVNYTSFLPTVEPPIKATTQNAKAWWSLVGGGHLHTMYESQTTRVKFFRQHGMEWYVYNNSKKIMKVCFPLPITGSFIEKIISYCLGQFIYGSALNY